MQEKRTAACVLAHILKYLNHHYVIMNSSEAGISFCNSEMHVLRSKQKNTMCSVDYSFKQG